MLLLCSRLAPGLVPRTVKRKIQLGSTVLKVEKGARKLGWNDKCTYLSMGYPASSPCTACPPTRGWSPCSDCSPCLACSSLSSLSNLSLKIKSSKQFYPKTIRVWDLNNVVLRYLELGMSCKKVNFSQTFSLLVWTFWTEVCWHFKDFRRLNNQPIQKIFLTSNLCP